MNPTLEEVRNKNRNPPRYKLCHCGNIVIQEACYEDNGSFKYETTIRHSSPETGLECPGVA